MEKTCSSCGVVQDGSRFTLLKSGKLYSYCRDCVNLRNKKYYIENQEKEVARARAQNPILSRAATAAWRIRNPGHGKEYALANREHLKLKSAEWAARNRGLKRAQWARYNAKKKRATPPWANHTEIQRRYDWAAMLGDQFGKPFHVDHIVPLQGKTVCGLHCETNLQVLPGAENQSKSNRYWPDMPEGIA